MGMPISTVVGGFAEVLRFAFQQHKRVEFREEKEGHEEGREDPDCVDVCGPAPAEFGVGHDGCADDGTQIWTAVYGDCVDAHCCAARFFTPHVAQRGGDVADGRGAKEAGEEAREEDGWGIATVRSANVEDRQAEDGGEHADTPTPDFGDGGPDDGAEDEAETGIG